MSAVPSETPTATTAGASSAAFSSTSTRRSSDSLENQLVSSESQQRRKETSDSVLSYWRRHRHVSRLPSHPCRARLRGLFYPSVQKHYEAHRGLEKWQSYVPRCLKYDVFEIFISLVVLLNIVLLALVDPTLPDDSGLNAQLHLADTVVTGVFTLELLCALLCCGFRYHFSSPWRVLDGFIVLGSAVSTVVGLVGGDGSSFAKGLALLRTARVLRPFKSMSRFPSFRILAVSVFRSFRSLLDITALFGLFLLLTGIAACGQYRGRLRPRCANSDYLNETIRHYMLWTHNYTLSDFLCGAQYDTDVLGIAGPRIGCDPDQLCDNSDSLFIRAYKCPWGYTCIQTDENPTYGYVSFDNTVVAMFTLFVMSTTEGWSEVMYALRDSTGVLAIPFCVFIVIFGGFCILQLAIVLITIDFQKVKEREEEKHEDQRNSKEVAADAALSARMARYAARQEARARRRERRKKRLQGTSRTSGSQEASSPFASSASFLSRDTSNGALSGGSTDDSSYDQLNDTIVIRERGRDRDLAIPIEQFEEDWSDEDRSDQNRNVTCQNCCYLCGTCIENYVVFPIRYWVAVNILQKRRFTYTVPIVICLNLLVLMTVFYGMPAWLEELQWYSSYAFTGLFSLELLLRFIGTDPKVFFKDFLIWIDIVVVAVGWCDLFADGFHAPFVRSLRAVRVVKLLEAVPAVYLWIAIIVDTIQNSMALILLIFVFVLVFACFGMQLFGGAFCGLTDEENTGYCSGRPRANFDAFGNAMVTCFQILTGCNWNDVMYDGMRAKGEGYAIYFMLLYYIGNNVLVNILVGILLTARTSARERNEAQLRVLGMHPSSAQSLTQNMSGEGTSSVLASYAAAVAGEEGEDDENWQERVDDAAEDEGFTVHEFSSRSTSFRSAPTLADHSSSTSSNGLAAPLLQPLDGISKEDSAIGEHRSVLRRAQPATPNRDDEVNTDEQVATRRARAVSFAHQESTSIVSFKPEEAVRSTKTSSSTGTCSGSRRQSLEDESSPPSSPHSLATASTAGMGFDSGVWNDEDDEDDLDHPDVDTNDFADERLLPQSRPRKALRYFLRLTAVTVFRSLVIVACAACQGLENPLAAPDIRTQRALTISDMVFTALFVLEWFIMSLGYGFGIGRGTYLGRSRWNLFDFALVVVSVAGSAMLFYRGNSTVSGVLVLRAFRPLRFVRSSESMRVVLGALLRSVLPARHILIVCAILFTLFGIVGVQLFQGSFYSCSDPSYPTEAECLENHEHWVNAPNHFDHIFAAYSSLFVLTSLDYWPPLMYLGIDAIGPGIAPKRNHNPAAAAYFLIFIVLSAFFLVNLFISVLIDAYDVEKRRSGKGTLLTQQQQAWVDAYGLILHSVPPLAPKYQKGKMYQFRLAVWRVVQSSMFEYIIYGLVVFNCVIVATDYYGASTGTVEFITMTNFVFVSIFIVEAIAKIFALRQRYFICPWNRWDLFVVLISLTGLVIEVVFSVKTVVSVFRAVRVLRLLRPIRSLHGIRHIMKGFLQALLPLSNVVAVMALSLFVFGVIGMNLFGRVTRNEAITHNANMENLLDAMLILLRAGTGGDTPVLIEAYSVGEPVCSRRLGDCGNSILAQVFFNTVVVIELFIMLNLFTAVVVESFAVGAEFECLKVTPKHAEQFVKYWRRYDPGWTMMVRSVNLPQVLNSLPLSNPLSIRFHFSDWLRPIGFSRGEFPFLERLELLETKEGYVVFSDVVIALCRVSYSCSNNDQVIQMLEKHSKGKLKCKKERIQPAVHRIAAVRIARWWRSPHIILVREELHLERIEREALQRFHGGDYVEDVTSSSSGEETQPGGPLPEASGTAASRPRLDLEELSVVESSLDAPPQAELPAVVDDQQGNSSMVSLGTTSSSIISSPSGQQRRRRKSRSASRLEAVSDLVSGASFCHSPSSVSSSPISRFSPRARSFSTRRQAPPPGPDPSLL